MKYSLLFVLIFNAYTIQSNLINRWFVHSKGMDDWHKYKWDVLGMDGWTDSELSTKMNGWKDEGGVDQ